MTLLICALSYADIKCGPTEANMELSMCVQLQLRDEEQHEFACTQQV